eukprot:CAMPEP_0114606696 /NCGR_PEP_ID=MMETSP0168-20121206/1696_1 /TAXON_ID=95228 ORGANISM="Vannella sp., Strain DIVA3 517/6/12" /NCGR_SAMPLE_ID=MMETSP0168 /ASSEMBLY_ACC=CAM_ASM_000044 /LENGTH=145 /DNA_ID=CAMNT_0001817571 /DNA_START=76 /DNA_END=510 /DNA_ORIENTATION=+
MPPQYCLQAASGAVAALASGLHDTGVLAAVAREEVLPCLAARRDRQHTFPHACCVPSPCVANENLLSFLHISHKLEEVLHVRPPLLLAGVQVLVRGQPAACTFALVVDQHQGACEYVLLLAVRRGDQEFSAPLRRSQAPAESMLW